MTLMNLTSTIHLLSMRWIRRTEATAFSALALIDAPTMTDKRFSLIAHVIASGILPARVRKIKRFSYIKQKVKTRTQQSFFASATGRKVCTASPVTSLL